MFMHDMKIYAMYKIHLKKVALFVDPSIMFLITRLVLGSSYHINITYLMLNRVIRKKLRSTSKDKGITITF